jgi:hypothetical protein
MCFSKFYLSKKDFVVSHYEKKLLIIINDNSERLESRTLTEKFLQNVRFNYDYYH